MDSTEVKPRRVRSAATARSDMEKCVPGGWWRHDAKLRALECLWPEWVTARQFFEFIVIFEPRWGRHKHAHIMAQYGLSRFHGYGLVDRIGTRRGGFNGRRPGTDWKNGWLWSRGYRYRLIRRTEDLL